MASPYAGRSGRPWRHIKARMKRQGGVCHLCGRPIDTTLQWPDPMSFTVDHIEPLSHNPARAHDMTNLAPAHLRCNASKGNGEAPEPTRNSRNW